MAVSFELPADIENNLRESSINLEQTAKEATLIELYRQERLSHYELSTALGITRLETEAVLKKHNVTADLLTSPEYESALSRLREITP